MRAPTAFSVTACGPASTKRARAAWSAAARLSSGVRRSRAIDICVSSVHPSPRRYSMASKATPPDLTIPPRDRRFGRGATTRRWWLRDDPVGSAMYDALSGTFPKGEAFFVESVRAFREGAPPRLAVEIKAFTTQEVMHSREHVQFNRRSVEAGYDMSVLERRVDERLAVSKTRPPI